jgi:DNA adenine methylase
MGASSTRGLIAPFLFCVENASLLSLSIFNMDPILKWPGGKRHLLKTLLPLASDVRGRYFEPFLGGGALYFAVAPKHAMLGDINPDLVNFYHQLVANPKSLVDRISKLKNNATTYYRLRASSPPTSLDQAVRFFFLNKTCFNGLYRTNLRGQFNVPFGNNKRAVLASPECFKVAARMLRTTTLRVADFESTCNLASKGDFVFLDPPYTVAHENNGFVRYNAPLFTWSDQARLREVVERLSSRGVRFVVTNASHPSIERLYKGFRHYQVTRMSLLSANSKFRRPVTELVTTNCH